MKKENNYGILAAVDWNSNKWQAPSNEDLSKVKFSYVSENNMTYTSLNFGYEIYEKDEEGYYAGLIPHFFSSTPDKEKSKHLQIVFIKSRDWHDGNTYIIGFYAFPKLQRGKKQVVIGGESLNFEYNIQSLPKDIHLLENYINLNTCTERRKFIPKNRDFGKMGYNYLTKANVEKILDVMSELNPLDSRLKHIKGKIFISLGNTKKII